MKAAFLTCVASVVSSLAASAQQVYPSKTYYTVAYADANPGSGIDFSGFNQPVISRTGSEPLIAFRASLNSPVLAGIWTGSAVIPNTITNIILTQQQAPAGSCSGGIIASINASRPPCINTSGEVVFFATVGSGSCQAGTQTIIRYSPNPIALTLVAQQWQTATSGLTFDSLEPGIGLSSGPAGSVSFVGTTPNIPTSAKGIWSFVSGGLQEIALRTDVAAGTGNQTFLELYGTADKPAFNSIAQSAFCSTVTGPNFVGIWTGVPTTSKTEDTLISLHGVLAPGTSAQFSGFEFPAINSLGEVAFRGKISGGTDSGIWKTVGTMLTMVTKQSSLAPNRSGAPTTATFTEFFHPAINNAGNVAFKAKLNNGEEGIWVEGNGLSSLHKIAKTGDPVPNTNVTLQTFNDFLVINNNNDQVAFTATLSDNSDGLFCTSDVGTLVKIVKEGDFYVLDESVDPPVGEVINTVEFFPGSIEQGVSGFNDAGALAYRLKFPNLKEAIVLTTLE